MVHCAMGLSRSPAVALALIVRGFVQNASGWRADAGLVEPAVRHLVELRPWARPNTLVLRLGLEQFLTRRRASRLCEALLQHPLLIRNRFGLAGLPES